MGAAAGEAGIHAPLAFVVAALGIAPTAASYAELSGRFPVSAGEAAFVFGGFKSQAASLLVGWLVILSGVVASATIAIGCAGYIRTFVDFPQSLAIVVVIVSMGLIATWGILESVLFAALLTLIEVGGLLALIYFGFSSGEIVADRWSEILPVEINLNLSLSISGACILAVFAFIGFEDMVNVAEETKRPRVTMPLAIFLTLAITTILYTLVTAVAVLSVPVAELAESEAPLSMVYEKLTGSPSTVLSVIAIFATGNTILVQFIMASRVVYGMATRGSMPSVFGRVNSITHTPVLATVAIVVATLILALLFPLERLAELTSQAILVIWILTNAALLMIKYRGDTPDDNVFIVPVWVPIFGLLFSLSMVVLSMGN